MPLQPEQQARKQIDALLDNVGWYVCDAGVGQHLFEYSPTRIKCRLESEPLGLNEAQMDQLFQVMVPNILVLAADHQPDDAEPQQFVHIITVGRRIAGASSPLLKLISGELQVRDAERLLEGTTE